MSWGPFDLAGRAAIVTGAARGIGFGIASRLCEAGADVLLTDLDGELAAAKVAELFGPGKAAAMAVDVADPEAGRKMVDECVSNFGSVDVLVNNAGIYPMSPMLDISREAWQRVIDVNLTGLAFVSKAVGKRMVEQGGGGKIINVASIDALHPSMVGLAAYDSSKGGVLMFTKALALEMAPYGVNVNAIAPGGINTEGASSPMQGLGLSDEAIRGMIERFTAMIPLRRMGEPDDIAKVAVFLASSASDYVTGEMLVVDGGRLLG
ncbi:MAG TPA: SDR family oxidoreductase [Acidimicrobiia bacterium]